ncbi:MAG: hypothetical protein VKQ33_16155 [Candidatus Sericytochromatia bacterium]|nr:hypothetical protein [Candidatus Sericytochromatia bacterium]
MKYHASRLVSLILCGLLVAGCGVPAPASSLRPGGAVEARTLAGLEDGFNLIYGAAFARADANGDLLVDEFEAGPFIDVRDFRRADGDRNGKLTEQEFRSWATRGWLFGLLGQDQKAFVRQQRRALLAAFGHLDADRSGLLSPAELADAAVGAAKIRLTLPGIKTSVQLEGISEAAFKEADRTGDAHLSQGEFEDLVITAWARLINPPRLPGAS